MYSFALSVKKQVESVDRVVIFQLFRKGFETCRAGLANAVEGEKDFWAVTKPMVV